MSPHTHTHTALEPSVHVSFISSMATRALLADAAALYQKRHPQVRIHLESMGGVDAAKRICAGQVWDGVVLAHPAICTLRDGGHLRAGSQVDLVQSAVAVAVPQGHALPNISDAAALRQAVLAAPSVGYSTGPSGTQLGLLFERWGIAQQVAARLVQAPPGVPVAALVATGEVAMGFQQLSEIQGAAGIQLVGELPADAQIMTTFTGAATALGHNAHWVQDILQFWQSTDCAQLQQMHGMRGCVHA